MLQIIKYRDSKSTKYIKYIQISHHVSSQVNTQDSNGAQGQRDVDQDEEEERGDLWDVTGQSVSNGFLQVVKDQTA